MENFKTISRRLQEEAKKFGYDMKLTHCQEIFAKLSGLENRHAVKTNNELFEAFFKQLSKKPIEPTTQYFRVQVGTLDPLSGRDPYRFYTFDTPMTEEAVTKWVMENKNLNEEDIFEVSELRQDDYEYQSREFNDFYYRIKFDDTSLILVKLSLKYFQERTSDELARKKALDNGLLTAKQLKKYNYVSKLTKKEYDLYCTFLKTSFPGFNNNILTIHKGNYWQPELDAIKKLIEKRMHQNSNLNYKLKIKENEKQLILTFDKIESAAPELLALEPYISKTRQVTKGALIG